MPSIGFFTQNHIFHCAGPETDSGTKCLKTMINSKFLVDKDIRVTTLSICCTSETADFTDEICNLMFSNAATMQVENINTLCSLLKRQEKCVGIIYCYTNIKNGKKYVGQTINPHQRHKNHQNANKDKNSIWHTALRRYGMRSFHYSILFVAITDNKAELQQTFLNEKRGSLHKKMRSSVKEWGYNVSQRGRYNKSNKTLEKPVDMFDLKGNFIKTHSSISAAKNELGLKTSTGISHAIKNHHSYAGFYWRKEYVERINPTEGKTVNKAPVMAIMPDGSVRLYEMIKEAARDLNICTTSIHHSIKAKHQTMQGIIFQRL